jgi:hypothetical protein
VRLLNAFDGASRARIDPHIQKITANRGEVLCEGGDIPAYAYFPDGASPIFSALIANQ